MKRTFISTGLSPDISNAVREFEEKFRTETGFNQRLIPPEKIHLTLKFLGPTQNEKIPEIISVLSEVRDFFSPFSLEVKGVGAFPNFFRPRVLWIGVHDITGELKRLADKIEERMEILGFARENRPFKPHLTISRIKTGNISKKEQTFLKEHCNFNLGPMEIKSIIYFESILKPEGAEYN
ncbi:MAG TPA: RNA 2',3'-cyclic phosphodiesterase, partial [Firmicutes bacterium]|nr:RNA 2',3'-cyclic phosphodiesterase [Bacillota bacterium]